MENGPSEKVVRFSVVPKSLVGLNRSALLNDNKYYVK